MLKSMEIQSNYSRISISPEKITLFYACSGRKPDKTRTREYAEMLTSEYTDDFAIIHLKEDLKLSDTVQIACVAEDISANSVGTKLDYYGFGSDPGKGARTDKVTGLTYFLRHETTQVHAADHPLEDYYFLGDSGGGSVARINGRITVVGVLCRADCVRQLPQDYERGEEHAAVGYYSDVICEQTGICKNSSGFNLFLLFVWITLGCYFH
uniref:Peptidase S1 domain-containing protein n=2 Tax=Caenorhabditis tropicalis TaxID=1561998 RepID=A0A1I7TU42_9PELO